MFFQTNDLALYVGQSPYGSKGYGDVAVAPPANVAPGQVARWVSTVERGAQVFGEAGTGQWEFVEDNRQATLYTTDRQQYSMGSEYEGQAYDGLGPIPAWLTIITPEPEPAAPVYPQFTALQLLDLFTETEQLAVVEATMSVAAVKLWYDRMIAATFVTYEDPRTEGGLQALVDAGLLTAGRKAEIVAAMQPGQ